MDAKDTSADVSSSPPAHTPLNLGAISPEKGAKYSPNLHAFLARRRNRMLRDLGSVYRDAAGVLWLGYLFDGEFIGTKLAKVLLSGERTELYTCTKMGPLEEVSDFWARYENDGRCAIDPEHKMLFASDSSRWSHVGEERLCVWCNKATQRRRAVSEVVVRRGSR